MDDNSQELVPVLRQESTASADTDQKQGPPNVLHGCTLLRELTHSKIAYVIKPYCIDFINSNLCTFETTV